MIENITDAELLKRLADGLNVSNQKLAELLGVTRAAVENWRYHGTRIPAPVWKSMAVILLERFEAVARVQDMAIRLESMQKKRDKQKP